MAISDQVRAPQGPADKKAKAWYALPGDEVAAKLGRGSRLGPVDKHHNHN
jgi:hypothetical protein